MGLLSGVKYTDVSPGWDMSQGSIQESAVEELRRLGLRAYEAKCFVALTKLPSGTTWDVSEQIGAANAGLRGNPVTGQTAPVTD